ncbi:MAG: rhomboid family intramembrane serine protease [Lachnospiraceae bacterium]|jgi:rhomboid protease GluP|nr:rhomboid family intramembrane serine protease [Lachnospiraceae bacterium]
MLDFRELLYRPDGRRRAFTNTLIVSINILVFAVLELIGDTTDPEFMYRWGASYPVAVMESKEYYRLFTSMFMHFGLTHLVNNMLPLFFLGDNLERAVGKVRYLIIYLGSGALGGLLSVYIGYGENSHAVGAGASGAIFGVFGALFFLVIYHRGRLEELTTRRLGLCIVLTLYSGFTSTGVDNFAHVGGLISGFLLAMIVGRRKRKGKSPYEN